MNIKNINGALFAMALVAAGAGFTSCEDEPDKYEVTGGTPTIDYVRPVDAASKDSLLTAASLNNTICIVGRNLRSVTQINFNDQSAVLNTSYMTDNTIIVTVPKAIPNEVSDKIYFITSKQDTVAYDFKTIVPAPTIHSMSNEWAAPGEEVTIKGDYFLDYDNSHLTIKVGDNYTIPYEDLKITQNSIRFNMPEDMPKHEPITITTINGTTKAGFRYMDNRGMLFDFDTPWKEGGEVLGNNGWHNRTIPLMAHHSLATTWFSVRQPWAQMVAGTTVTSRSSTGQEAGRTQRPTPAVHVCRILQTSAIGRT